MSNKIVTLSKEANTDTKRLSDAVEFDFDEFEIVELENREEFRVLADCGGGGGGGGGHVPWFSAPGGGLPC